MRFLAEAAAIGLAQILLRVLPLDVAAKLGGCLAVAIGPRTSLHKRAMRNLEVAFPEKTDAERHRIADAMWRNTGKVAVETLLLDRVISDPRRLTVVEPEVLANHLKTEPGTPELAITLHYGNWETAAYGWRAVGGWLAGVYRPPANPYLDRLLLRRRSPLFPGGLIAKGQDVHAARHIAHSLRNGGQIGLICDQADRNGIRVPFFGRSALFTPAPAMMARREGARVWVSRCVRIGSGVNFAIEYTEIVIPRTSDAAADVRAGTAAMARLFETWIREKPEQWMWWQRREIGDSPAT